MRISIANVDGVITAAEEAKVPMLDRGFLFGDSIYETLRTYDGVPFLYDQHLDRLENSARLLGMRMAQSRQLLKDEIRRTAAASGAKVGQELYIRLTLTRGVGPIDLFPAEDLRSSYIVFIKELPAWNARLYASGLRLAIPRVRRNAPHTLDPNIKSGNYLNNVLAITEARRLDADDALMCSIDGRVAEATNSNIFFVLDGTVVTPAAHCSNLKGTTKRMVLEICAQQGWPVAEREILPEELPMAAECFVSSTTREVMPVRSVRLEDGTLLEFPEGGGSITRAVHAAFRAEARRYTERHRAEQLY